LQAGAWGYLLYVLLLILSIPLPLPSTPIALAGGYVYGVAVGTVLALLAALAGSLISFCLVRRLGKSFLERLVAKHHIIHLRHIFKKRGLSAVLVSYALPIFPSDAVSLILGLTPIRVGTFIWVFILGNIPRYLITSSLGQDLYSGISLKTVLFLLLAAIFILIAIFREQVKRLIFHEIKELEKEGKIVEQDVEQEVGIIEKDLGLEKKKKRKKK